MQTGRRKFVMGPCLGRGGFGEVYRATTSHPGGLETVVAVKVLRSDVDPAGDAVRRLRDEGRLLARLDHPTILRVHDLCLLDGRVALVTEYVDGADLADCWTGVPPLSPRGLFQVVGRIAGALAAAHRATDAAGAPLGLVHRDVKPTNIRVGRHGEVKLLDFGIAWSRATDREARTDSDLVVGSLHYMAPERFVSKRANPAWDVAGLGTVLHEGLTGERFLPDTMRDAVQLAVRSERYEKHLVERLALLARRHPPEVVDLVRRTLAWDGADRIAAADLEVRCEQIADAIGGPTLSRWCRDRQWAAPEGVDGELAGRTLTEGTLDLAIELATLGDEGRPRLVPGPVPTLESPTDPTPRVRPEPSTVRRPEPPAAPAYDPLIETTFEQNPLTAPTVVPAAPQPSPAPPAQASSRAGGNALPISVATALLVAVGVLALGVAVVFAAALVVAAQVR